jgi:hypothetical protein
LADGILEDGEIIAFVELAKTFGIPEKSAELIINERLILSDHKLKRR